MKELKLGLNLRYTVSRGLCDTVFACFLKGNQEAKTNEKVAECCDVCTTVILALGNQRQEEVGGSKIGGFHASLCCIVISCLQIR